jgi:membrane-associated phospholipid phosphatase
MRYMRRRRRAREVEKAPVVRYELQVSPATRVSDRGQLAELLRVAHTMPGVRLALTAAPVLATVLVLAAISGAPSPGDLRIGQALQDTPGGSALARVAVVLAYPGVEFVVWFAGLFAAIRMRNTPLIVAALLVLIAFGVNPLLKDLIARSRPSADELIIRRAVSGYGFPSGHTQDATQMYGYAALALAAYRRVHWAALVTALAWAAIALIGFERVYDGAHWPSDVVGGFAFGVLVLVLSVYSSVLACSAREPRAPTSAAA